MFFAGSFSTKFSTPNYRFMLLYGLWHISFRQQNVFFHVCHHRVPRYIALPVTVRYFRYNGYAPDVLVLPQQNVTVSMSLHRFVHICSSFACPSCLRAPFAATSIRRELSAQRLFSRLMLATAPRYACRASELSAHMTPYRRYSRFSRYTVVFICAPYCSPPERPG